MTRLVLIRHGESNVTVAKVIGGMRTCSGLSPLGRRQAEALAHRLRRTRELEADRLIASTMPRAIETAAALLPVFDGQELEHRREFCEHDPGDCDGMTFAEYVAVYGTPDWGGDPDTVIFPGGETLRQFHLRVRGGLDDLVERHRGERIVLVCHGGVIDAALRHLLGLEMLGGFELHTVNTSITELVQGAEAPRAPNNLDGG